MFFSFRNGLDLTQVVFQYLLFIFGVPHICEDTSNELVWRTMTWEVIWVMWNLSSGANTPRCQDSSLFWRLALADSIFRLDYHNHTTLKSGQDCPSISLVVCEANIYKYRKRLLAMDLSIKSFENIMTEDCFRLEVPPS